MDNILKHISLTLKTLRKEKGWSLDKAAENTGVSKAMLGQIERQESSPTISTLWKIASGFNASFSSFIQPLKPTSKKMTHRPGQTEKLHPHDDKIRVATLFPFDKELSCEIFLIELLPGCIHLSPPHQAGVIEHILVTDGTMEVLIGNKWKKLKTGEGLRFNANQPHGYRNKSLKPASFHDVIHYLKT